eukprot:CAMPEP_0176488658 /NCGR_PEP_ID=MMETSP0200_2-20121128/6836_1 /TAXON_ID=947934 /ORGANISM="Chaetoceros sp., Strain GSL56" /LENGTH=459 /DNA_ID=CAMNT_0017885675 /DNA_START=241 /DNA_END=1620 /DNA_ORIENTATION=+
MKSLVVISTALVLAIVSTFVSSQTYETTISRRERNLDHWDAETLAAYLGLDPDTAKPLEEDQYTGIDAAVMFYAQWCSNCHRFATVWDTIGQLLHAGTTESNLIMALFNCELNQKHTRLCDAAGVTHYPTLMFVGAGPYHDSDPITSAVFGSKASGPYGPTKLQRTVKFQGNLNIGDSVLDWIKAMRGLSTWYKWNHMEAGWLKGIRGLLSNPFRRKISRSKSENALPVGIPTGLFGGRTGKGAQGSIPTYALEKQLKTAQEKLDSVQNQLDETQLATTHAGYLIDSFLFPVTSNSTDAEGNLSKVPVDIFSIMNETGAWDASIQGSKVDSDDDVIILKSCLVDLTLDYCTRFSSKTTIDYLDGLGDLPNDEYPSFVEMEKQLRSLIEESEPYCAKFSTCYENGFLESEGCRPATCPFQNEVACRYVSACMSKSVQEEYRDALQKNAVDVGGDHEGRDS